MDNRIQDGKERILNAVTTTATSESYNVTGAVARTYQVVASTTAGAGTATVEIQVSNDGTNWLLLGTIPLTLSTTPSTDGLAANAPWAFTRAKVTALTGTGANVTVILGV